MMPTNWRNQAFAILIRTDDGEIKHVSETGLCRGSMAVHRTWSRQGQWTVTHRVVGLRLVRRISSKKKAIQIAEDVLNRWGETLSKPKDALDVDAIYHSADSVDLSEYLRQLQDGIDDVS